MNDGSFDNYIVKEFVLVVLTHIVICFRPFKIRLLPI